MPLAPSRCRGGFRWKEAWGRSLAAWEPPSTRGEPRNFRVRTLDEKADSRGGVCCGGWQRSLSTTPRRSLGLGEFEKGYVRGAKKRIANFWVRVEVWGPGGVRSPGFFH